MMLFKKNPFVTSLGLSAVVMLNYSSSALAGTDLELLLKGPDGTTYPAQQHTEKSKSKEDESKTTVVISVTGLAGTPAEHFFPTHTHTLQQTDSNSYQITGDNAAPQTVSDVQETLSQTPPPQSAQAQHFQDIHPALVPLSFTYMYDQDPQTVQFMDNTGATLATKTPGQITGHGTLPDGWQFVLNTEGSTPPAATPQEDAATADSEETTEQDGATTEPPSGEPGEGTGTTSTTGQVEALAQQLEGQHLTEEEVDGSSTADTPSAPGTEDQEEPPKPPAEDGMPGEGVGDTAAEPPPSSSPSESEPGQTEPGQGTGASSTTDQADTLAQDQHITEGAGDSAAATPPPAEGTTGGVEADTEASPPTTNQQEAQTGQSEGPTASGTEDDDRADGAATEPPTTSGLPENEPGQANQPEASNVGSQPATSDPDHQQDPQLEDQRRKLMAGVRAQALQRQRLASESVAPDQPEAMDEASAATQEAEPSGGPTNIQQGEGQDDALSDITALSSSDEAPQLPPADPADANTQQQPEDTGNTGSSAGTGQSQWPNIGAAGGAEPDPQMSIRTPPVGAEEPGTETQDATVNFVGNQEPDGEVDAEDEGDTAPMNTGGPQAVHDLGEEHTGGENSTNSASGFTMGSSTLQPGTWEFEIPAPGDTSEGMSEESPEYMPQ